MRRALVLLPFLLCAAPAWAGSVVLRAGTGRDCYLQTLQEASPLHNQRGLAVCDRAVADSLSALDSYDRTAAFVNRADIKLRAQDYAGAVADSEAAIAINPKLTAAQLNRGAGLIGLKHFADALPVLDKAIALDNGEMELAYFNRALAKEALGDISGAYHDYLKAAQINPRFQRATDELARFKVVGSTG